MKYSFLVFIALFSFVFTSCSEEGCMNPLAQNFDPSAINSCEECCVYENNDAKAVLKAVVTPTYENDEVSVNANYNWNGRSIAFSSIRYYLTNFKAADQDLSIANDYVLLSLLETEMDLGEIDARDYDAIQFALGVKPTDNHQVPNAFGVNHPLSPKTPSLFWNVNDGHVFFEMRGMVDTNGVPDGIVDTEFLIQIGTDALFQNINLAKNFSVPTDLTGSITLHLTLDLATLIEDLTIPDLMQVNQTTPTSMNLVANKFQDAFSFE